MFALPERRPNIFLQRFSLYGFYKDISSKVLSEATYHCMVFTKIFLQRFSWYGFYKDILTKSYK